MVAVRKASEQVATGLAAALALFPAQAAAQTMADAAPGVSLEVENAYRTRMRDFITSATTIPAAITGEQRRTCEIRAIGMTSAIRSINGSAEFRPVLMAVSQQYLSTLADYSSCKEMTGEQVRRVGTHQEHNLFRLLRNVGAVPSIEIIPVNGFRPDRPSTVSSLEGAPALAAGNGR